MQLSQEDAKGLNSSAVEMLNECIKELLSVMTGYVSLPNIIMRVINKHGDLEICSFKDMFSSMLLTYFYQEKILATAKGIMSMEVSRHFHNLKKAMGKAVFVRHSVCGKCNDTIQWHALGEAVAFSCGHVYHEKCAGTEQSCSICLCGSFGRLSLQKLLKRHVMLKKKMKNGKEDSLSYKRKKAVHEKKAPENAVKKGYMSKQEIFERTKVKSFYAS
eukprot:TRINITY_DN6671_c0_g1_i2.p1 TRINITY_DN6671_c0_g1~~TRINITY_DN6671_c0_g1_i2.p1  ORF type:complete len:251 (-),score=79.36 TRINITY_DN6671_c0_g1_i2:56-706(-)